VGAAVVFLTANISPEYLDASLGMAAGVMIAASL
jgi:zinc transporter ZupT